MINAGHGGHCSWALKREKKLSMFIHMKQAEELFGSEHMIPLSLA
jgi:hypothetical protein